jgi:hypothetical protein
MRSRSMQALTNDIQREVPGATVWGKGDAAHQSSTSDHNEDDTMGSRPEQQDADNVPEHRAIDVPIMGPMTMPKLQVLRRRLTDRPANRPRMRYVILEQWIWRKRNGWVAERYTGEYHNHLHVSGDAADDENGAGWDIGPDPVPAASPNRRTSMSTLYFNKTTRKEWALAGDSPGTPANWLTTAEQGVANAWAGAHGSAVELEQHSYDDFRERYTMPLNVSVENLEGGAL